MLNLKGISAHPRRRFPETRERGEVSLTPAGPEHLLLRQSQPHLGAGPIFLWRRQLRMRRFFFHPFFWNRVSLWVSFFNS